PELLAVFGVVGEFACQVHRGASSDEREFPNRCDKPLSLDLHLEHAEVGFLVLEGHALDLALDGLNHIAAVSESGPQHNRSQKRAPAQAHVRCLAETASASPLRVK